MNRFLVGMFVGAVLAFLITVTNARADTRHYNNEYGSPAGSANQVGSTTYYSGPYGQPRGSASTYGNTTYYYNQYGQPLGSSSTYGAQPSYTPPPVIRSTTR